MEIDLDSVDTTWSIFPKGPATVTPTQMKRGVYDRFNLEAAGGPTVRTSDRRTP